MESKDMSQQTVVMRGPVEFSLESPGFADRKSDIWETPPAFFRAQHDKFAFTVDAAATAETTRLPSYFIDGLLVSWEGERIWCNPPYSKPEPWVRKALAETRHGKCPLAVLLLPVDTSTAWFHNFVWVPGVEVQFVKGRLRFSNAGPARFASMLAIYRSIEFAQNEAREIA